MFALTGNFSFPLKKTHIKIENKFNLDACVYREISGGIN